MQSQICDGNFYIFVDYISHAKKCINDVGVSLQAFVGALTLTLESRIYVLQFYVLSGLVGCKA
jgi:hypothetical protein